MTLWFDNGDRSGNGTVIEDHAKNNSTIETGFDNDASGILDDLANAKQVKVTFHSGNEPAWVTTSMNGSRKAVERVQDVRQLGQGACRRSQPARIRDAADATNAADITGQAFGEEG